MTPPKEEVTSDERATFEAWWQNAIGLYDRKDLAWHAWSGRAASTATATDGERTALRDAFDDVYEWAKDDFVAEKYGEVEVYRKSLLSILARHNFLIKEKSAACQGCYAFDSGASEVNFVQGCAGCVDRMKKVAGLGSLYARAAAPQAGLSDEQLEKLFRIAYSCTYEFDKFRTDARLLLAEQAATPSPDGVEAQSNTEGAKLKEKFHHA